MADQWVRFPDYDAAAKQRGLSAGLWNVCPLTLLGTPIGLNEGFVFFDDFIDLPTGKYTVTQAGSAGTLALTDAIGGVAEVNSGHTDNGDGANVLLGPSTTGELFIPSEAADIYFEARIKFTASTTTPEFFIGLSEQDTTLMASDANSSANHIGFEITRVLPLRPWISTRRRRAPAAQWSMP